MRRKGFIIEEITTYANMEKSFRKVLAGTHRKNTRSGKYLLAHKEEVIEKLTKQIADGSYRVSYFYEKHIPQAGKTRRIQVIPLYDRIATHAIMNVVDEHMRSKFIRTTSASIKGRGMHDLMKYIQRDMQDDPFGTQYCYKFDINKFYESIKPDHVMACLRRMFKDEKLLSILDGFMQMMPNGLSIGLRSSQGLGNLLLSVHLDHYLKEERGICHYYRYCDDIVILGATKAELWEVREIIHERVKSIGLEVKASERIFPVEEGIDFLGYVIRPDYVRLRKRVKENFAEKFHKIKSKRRRREVLASFYGMTKHADCRRLFFTLTGNNMKDFKSLNVTYKPEDGKKRFAGEVVSIRTLVNLKIVVKDYEEDVKTENGDRWLVAIELDGESKKFFTDSKEMKNILMQIKEIPDGFPFETVIKAELFGKGKTKYVFS
ncbi:reverse transcriptase domain-containing protein [uncultured Culturomica sp.]|uniref:reverse transcriptase domain-containing protein n=1 Tax=uncultured Culturomica sp. TaxID=1926654 RepID=UPI00033A75E3|nr:reverse transcriptase domain-containing protein [uncultured Culturomica sp.]CCZ10524.1 putative uncharacterized protein [Odoribacter sp. CAG:788]